MNFVNWIYSQDKRKDEVGWFARQIKATQKVSNTVSQYQGLNSIRKYALTLPNSKMKKCLTLAAKEWVKASRSPRVGIFWIVDGDVIDWSEEARDVPSIAGFRDGSYDHMLAWNQMQKVYPEFREREYFDIPRGRVLAVSSDKGGFPETYRIFVPPEEAGNQALISKVRELFNLPASRTEVWPDEHYSLVD